MEKFSAARIFGEEETSAETTDKKVQKKNSKKKTLLLIGITVLIFVLFFCFLLKQNSYVYLSHDDYGYATLSYVYWEDDMWGQSFTLEQMTHYLTEHYNRWGGRILSFAQEILLLQRGTDVMRAFNACAVALSFVLALCIAQRGKKSALLPLSALFAVSLFGFLGKSASIRGMYWYTASILYTVPIAYIFAGTLLLYVTVFGQTEKKFALSKILMIPMCTVLFFFGAFSMEQVGISAVMTVAVITVYSTFKHRNPLMLIYTVPPLLSSLYGYHILITAVGNESRKNMHTEFYAKSLPEQMLEGGKNIAETVFQSGNLAFVILIAAVTLLIVFFLIRKHRKNPFFILLGAIDTVGAVFSVVTAKKGTNDGLTDIFLWCWLFLMAITVSIWLFSSKSTGDFVIWSVFFGGLVSQGACLISPIYYDSCFIIFFMCFAVVSIRAFAEITGEFSQKTATVTCTAITVIAVAAGSIGAGKIFFGFKQNVRVQEYNESVLTYAGEMYDRYGYVFDKLPLMRLKDETYTGSTMPYDRDLIKDWMKIYYKLPVDLQYTDFEYEPYSEERLAELEEEFAETKKETDARFAVGEE